MLQLDGLQLTKEQLQIVATCSPPASLNDNSIKNSYSSNTKSLSTNGKTGRITDYYDSSSNNGNSNNGGKLVRITAAAGAGKTTTLLAIALRAIELGHTHISYVTFTNAAANDGKVRLEKALQSYNTNTTGSRNPITIEARTLHSFAIRLLQLQYKNTSNDDDENAYYKNTLWTDQKIQKWIASECADAIDDFIRPCYSELEMRFRSNSSKNNRRNDNDNKVHEMKETALKQVQFFLFKSLKHFCHNSWTLEVYSGKGNVDDEEEEENEYSSYYSYKKRTSPIPFGRDYYPVKLFHEKKKSNNSGGGRKLCGEDIGFLPRIYESKIGWYADQVVLLWNKIIENGIRSFDFDMKRVQLEKLTIPGTILLVDESQDMDACQVDWAIQQQVTPLAGESNKIVYVVGDPAQSIYGFRGAKPQFLMELNSHIDLKLTDSWRFGLTISHIANLILYSKEKSDQTTTGTKKRPSWNPYRVRPGILDKESIVTTTPLINQWKDMKVTIIAATNVSLLVQALSLLGYSLDSPDDEAKKEEGNSPNDDFEGFEPTSESGSTPSDTDYDSDDYIELEDEIIGEQEEIGSGTLPLEFPKIHINGKGESSGSKLWKKTIELINDVFRLYKLTRDEDSFPIALDKKLFPDFVGRKVTWKSFTEECEFKELQRYQNAIYVVKCCKLKTPEAINFFKQHVLDMKFTAAEADIILTTCHSAKGMEWDNVHVCDDFIQLCSFKQQDQTSNSYSRFYKPPPSSPLTPKVWKFDFDEWSDNLNVLYVACTRAKCRLYIPECVCKALRAMDLVHRHVHNNNQITSTGNNVTIKSSDVSAAAAPPSSCKPNMIAFQIPGYKKPLTPSEVTAFYKCLVEPLRKEYKVPSPKHSLLQMLHIEKGDNELHDSDDNETELKFKDEDFFGSTGNTKQYPAPKRKRKPSTKPKSSYRTKRTSK